MLYCLGQLGRRQILLPPALGVGGGGGGRAPVVARVGAGAPVVTR